MGKSMVGRAGIVAVTGDAVSERTTQRRRRLRFANMA
jgi:hypothetical protein